MNLWTFGCSFTNGQDSDGENYIEFEKSWPYLLSKKLNLGLKNKGLIRSSNEMILDTVLHNQDKIEKNDLVVILMTYASRLTRKQDQLRGLTVSESDYKTLVRIIGDIDYMINLRTVNTLLALNSLPIKNKMIFSIDSVGILECLSQYEIHKSSISHFYFWPKIDFKKHIIGQGIKGHPDAKENQLMCDMIYNILTKTQTEAKIATWLS